MISKIIVYSAIFGLFLSSYMIVAGTLDYFLLKHKEKKNEKVFEDDLVKLYGGDEKPTDDVDKEREEKASKE